MGHRMILRGSWAFLNVIVAQVLIVNHDMLKVGPYITALSIFTGNNILEVKIVLQTSSVFNLPVHLVGSSGTGSTGSRAQEVWARITRQHPGSGCPLQYLPVIGPLIDQ